MDVAHGCGEAAHKWVVYKQEGSNIEYWDVAFPLDSTVQNLYEAAMRRT